MNNGMKTIYPHELNKVFGPKKITKYKAHEEGKNVQQLKH